MKFGIIEIIVDGVLQKLDVDAELAIHDIDTDMSQVAAQMAFWGALQGEAESQKVIADAEYRLWRAQYGERLLTGSSLAEWKVKQAIEASSKFMIYKESIAKAARNAAVLRAIFLAFQTKSSMLQSKGARARAEIEATGQTTKRRVSSDERNIRKEKMRTIHKNKNAGKGE